MLFFNLIIHLKKFNLFFRRSKINQDGSEANVTLSQRSPFDPTVVSIDINSSESSEIGGIRIHSLPTLPHYYEYNPNRCYGIKDVFNPTNKGIGADAPFPG